MMKRVQIPKGNGKFRQIYIPSEKEMTELRELLPQLNQMERDRARHFDVFHVAHGFVAGRNPVTCALRHVGYDVTFSFDLSSWFDSVTQEQLIQAGVEPAMAHAITVDGALRQGLPTSPVAANLVAVGFDRQLMTLVKRRLETSNCWPHDTGEIQIPFAYTRYADDVSLSVKLTGLSLIEAKWAVESSVQDTVGIAGWTVAHHKTRVQSANAGRRIVVGIAVGQDDIQPTRETKRRLRAAKHKKNTRQVNGLREWAACKLPRSARGTRRIAGVTPGSPAITKVLQPEVVTNVVSTGVRRLSFD